MDSLTIKEMASVAIVNALRTGRGNDDAWMCEHAVCIAMNQSTKIIKANCPKAGGHNVVGYWCNGCSNAVAAIQAVYDDYERAIRSPAPSPSREKGEAQ